MTQPPDAEPAKTVGPFGEPEHVELLSVGRSFELRADSRAVLVALGAVIVSLIALVLSIIAIVD